MNEATSVKWSNLEVIKDIITNYIYKPRTIVAVTILCKLYMYMYIKYIWPTSKKKIPFSIEHNKPITHMQL